MTRAPSSSTSPVPYRMHVGSRISVRLTSVLGALLVGVAVAAQPAAQTPGRSVARFDWFSYEGRDSVYDRTPAGPDTYRNPILAGFYPDPTVIRGGDGAYYLANSSFAYYPGVPIFRSTDLVHWTQIGHVLDRPSQLPLDSARISGGVYAPALSYHNGTYYMITTIVGRVGNFIVTATNPAGPWSDPIVVREVDGIDPSLFFDDDGRAYVVNNGPPATAPLYEGHRAIWIQEYDVARKRMTGPRTVIVDGGVALAKHPIWIEGPHLFKRNGHYYLICAEGGTAYQHSEVVFRGDSPRGPWTPYAGNPILTQRALDPWRPFPITTTGHADFVQTPAGEWWAVFLGVRPYTDDVFNTGRETFLLPVRWENDWPVITRDQERVAEVHERPTLPAATATPIPTTGNFAMRDDFTARTLAPYWIGIRTPREPYYDLTSTPGSLTLYARPVDIGAFGQPSFVGRRQQHTNAVASTMVRFTPTRDGDRAGLVAFQNDSFYYALTVAMARGARVVQLEERAGAATHGTATVLGSAPLTTVPNAPVYLRITARGGRYDFDYATRDGAWTSLVRDADGSILSTRIAGGFVGTVIGMYAHAGP